jgi:hypothetical protein
MRAQKEVFVMMEYANANLASKEKTALYMLAVVAAITAR